MLPLFPLALLFAGFQPRARIYGIMMCPETTTTMMMLAQLNCRSRNRMPTVKSKILTIFTDCFWEVAFSWISFNFLKNLLYHLQFLSFVLLFFAQIHPHATKNNISLVTTRKNSAHASAIPPPLHLPVVISKTAINISLSATDARSTNSRIGEHHVPILSCIFF